MTGRKPKPLRRALAEGDTRQRGIHKLEKRLAAEPSTTRGLPEPPEHLNERARDAWEFWAAELHDMKLDSRPDAMMLEGACVHYARAVQADLIVAQDGLIVEELKYVGEGDTAEAVVMKRRNHPAIAISNAAWRHVRAFCSEFGLSPVSRTRLAIERKDDETEDLQAILNQARKPRAEQIQ